MTSEELQAVKVGDRLLVSYGMTGKRIDEVTKITKTQIVCGTRRYRLKDGFVPGKFDYRSGHIVRVATTADELYLRRMAIIRRLGSLGLADFDKLPDDRLKQVCEAIWPAEGSE